MHGLVAWSRHDEIPPGGRGREHAVGGQRSRHPWQKELYLTDWSRRRPRSGPWIRVAEQGLSSATAAKGNEFERMLETLLAEVEGK